jgi:hypothetical protein
VPTNKVICGKDGGHGALRPCPPYGAVPRNNSDASLNAAQIAELLPERVMA